MKLKGKTVFVYDIEVFPNCFHCSVKNTETGERYKFEISHRKNDIKALAEFFWRIDNPNNKENDRIFCGYNCIHYDNPIVNFIIENYDSAVKANLSYDIICSRLYSLSNLIITSETSKPWSHWKYGHYFDTLDLLTMLFSQALRCGLKEMQVTMRYKNVQEYDGDFTKDISDEDIPKMIAYNDNDVDSTEELLNRCEKQIDLRLGIADEYGVDVLSKDGMTIGVEILKTKYLEKTGKSWYDIKDLRSPADTIDLNSIILPFIRYEDPILQDLLVEMKTLNVSPGRKGYEKHFLFGNIEISVGVGGIHSINKPECITPNEDEYLQDIDVASLYPSLSIIYEFYPPHLGHEFIEVYSAIKEERIQAKHSGQKVKNETLKLALNGTTGNYQQPYSWLYSPVTAMQIRINGQLLLLMLAEKLVKAGCRLIQINTDGIFYIGKNDKRQEIENICKEWENLTKLTLEGEDFEAMYQYAVNDYIAVGKGYSESHNPKLIKTKGMFLTEVSLGKGMPPQIIPEAIIKCLVDKIPVEDTVKSCRDLNKFITYQKVGKQFSVEYDGKIIQRINRFYMSTKDALYLYKCKVDANGKRSNYEKINAQSGVTIVNRLDTITEFPTNINYQYYINQANAIVSEMTTRQLSIFDLFY